MKIAAEGVQTPTSVEDIETLCDSLSEQLGGSPDLLVVQRTEHASLAPLEAACHRRFPGAAMVGATSCGGVMTHKGIFGFNGDAGFALWGLRDPDGAYGAALRSPERGGATAALEALDAALDAADRPGELPDLVWVYATPGLEEDLVLALSDALGGRTPIVGGAAADNSVGENWRVMANDRSAASGVAVAVLFPGARVGHSFQSGYAPTETRGVATKVSGPILEAIDGRPAAEVYKAWLEGAREETVRPSDAVSSQRAFTAPLGVEIGRVLDDSGLSFPYFNLVHPRAEVGDGLHLFTSVREGDLLTLMRGSSTSIVDRAPLVVDDALLAGDIAPENLAGALAVFCASFMLEMHSELPGMVDSVRARLRDAPFLCGFSFGETGTFLGGESRHGNLMMSQTVFSR